MTSQGHAHCVNEACKSKQAPPKDQDQQGINKSLTAVVRRWLMDHLFALRSNLRGFGGTGNAMVAGGLSTVLLSAIAYVLLPTIAFPLAAGSGVVIAGLGLTVFAMLNAERRKSAYKGLAAARRCWMAQLAVVPIFAALILAAAWYKTPDTLPGTALLAFAAFMWWGLVSVRRFEKGKDDLEAATLGTFQHQTAVRPAKTATVSAKSPAPVVQQDEEPAWDAAGFPIDPYAPASQVPSTKPKSPIAFERLEDLERPPVVEDPQPTPPPPPQEPQASQQNDIVSHPTIEYAPEVEDDSPEKVMAELKAFRGQEEATQELIRLIKGLPIQKRRIEQGALKGQLEAFNYRFEGPPGTGKTKLAKFLSRALLTAEIVESPHIVKAKAKDLVGGYIGQSAHLTQSTIEQSRGGILLVDEAYKLRADDANSQGADFKNEALDTLVEAMGEEDNRLVVIFCGYPDDIEALMTMNDGLSSRFTGGTVPFRRYDASDLTHISVEFLEQSSYHLTEEALELAEKRFVDVLNRPFARRKDWGNARDARTICSQMTIEHRARLSDLEDVSDDLLSTLGPEDVDAGFETFIAKRERGISTETSSLLIQ